MSNSKVPEIESSDSAERPIRLERGPLRTFVEVPFKKGSQFRSIELQLIQLKRDGQVVSGHLVKIQSWQDTADLYFESVLNLTESHIEADPAFAHMGITHLGTAEFAELSLEVDALSATVALDFVDKSGARVTMHVSNKRPRPAHPLFIPAPPQTRPVGLRLLHLDRFWVFKKSDTDMKVTIAGEQLELESFLVPERIATHWGARAATGLDLSGINPPKTHPEFGNEGTVFSVETTQSGGYTIEGPLGVVTDGELETDPHGSLLTMSARQNWEPGWKRPAAALLAAIRRSRRRNENWRLSVIDGEGPPQWTTVQSNE